MPQWPPVPVRIFRDLYDFDEPNLTEDNYRDLFDKVANGWPNWARSVLRDGSTSRTVVTSLGSRRGRVEESDYFYYTANAIICLPRSGDRPGYSSRVGRTTVAPNTAGGWKRAGER